MYLLLNASTEQQLKMNTLYKNPRVLVDAIAECFKDTLDTIKNRTKHKFKWSQSL